jgi:hypothetical protein
MNQDLRDPSQSFLVPLGTYSTVSRKLERNKVKLSLCLTNYVLCHEDIWGKLRVTLLVKKFFDFFLLALQPLWALAAF